MPFINEVIMQLNNIISDLQPAQVHTVYEALAVIISAQNPPHRDFLVKALFATPNEMVHLPQIHQRPALSPLLLCVGLLLTRPSQPQRSPSSASPRPLLHWIAHALLATLVPFPSPPRQWRSIMTRAAQSLDVIRAPDTQQTLLNILQVCTTFPFPCFPSSTLPPRCTLR